jgi:hypothetical protein
MRDVRRFAIPALAALVCAAALAAAPSQGGRAGRGQRPQRDAAAVPAGTAAIAGRVTAAETGRPLKRSRVLASGGGRQFSALTDAEGRYRVPALPAGTYTITATRTGYVDAVFGQRRPLSPGTPIPVADGQQVGDVNLRLTRGGVLAGRVVDEDGQPLALAIITAHRQQYVRGEKQLTPIGTDRSDDRGEYRIFGLPPGEYFVSATIGGIDRLVQQVEVQPESTGYAATYYPGVVGPADAGRVQLGPGQEMTGLEFQLQLVPLATVRGVVTGRPDAVVVLMPEGGGRGAGRGVGGGAGRGAGRAVAGLGGGIGAIEADGTFVIRNVTPGRYTIVARATDDSGATAIQPLTVTGDVTVALTMAPGVEVGGTVTLESAAGQVPRGFQGFRIALRPTGAAARLPGNARPAVPDEKGSFSLSGVFPGHYLVDATAPAGWTMKAVYLDGADATDRAVEITSSSVRGLNVIFTDRVATLIGTVVTDTDANPAGISVIAFPSDEALWFPESRHIRTARADQAGAYRIVGLPPGDYLVVAVDDVEPGEWFDPAFLERMTASAVKLRIGEGEQHARDLKVPATPPASRPF